MRIGSPVNRNVQLHRAQMERQRDPGRPIEYEIDAEEKADHPQA
jgi:hypothetical protein